MSRVRKTIGLVGIATAFVTIAMVAPAAAAPPSGLTISPPLKEVVINSGLLKAAVPITVTNTTGKDLSANVRVVDLSATNEFGGTGLSQVGVPGKQYGLAKWLTLPSGTTAALPNGKPTTVMVTVDNRTDLTPGGHYGAVIVSAGSTATANGNRVSFKQELVSLLFVKKTGGERYGLELSSMKPSSGFLPTSVALTFKSTGNVHVVPRGTVTIASEAGKIVAKGVIDPESTFILPGTSRQFITVLQPVGDASIPGRYKMTASYRYDGEDKFTTKSLYISHWKIPKLLIAGVILTVVALFVTLRFTLRKFKL